MPMHQYKLRVYFEDTDHTGVVYHPNYLKYMERARTELLNEAMGDWSQLSQQGTIFTVASIDLRYYRPAKFNQILIVNTLIKKLAAAYLIFEQTITVENVPTVDLCCGEIKVACVSSDFKPKRLPSDIRTQLHGY